ncbi:hypothetical protein [Saccharopolyspora sp. 5N708]|uniref:hypothetical protein n=1 Tax=Saccharopolyspora sp. 5N708 TaxID=3457424 RepID=UPI003FD3C1FC
MAKIRESIPKGFIWTFLIFLCAFGFAAWLFFVQDGPEIATILSLVVGVIALIANPTNSRTSVWVALASALVLVALGTLGYVSYEHNRSLNVTHSVKIGEPTSGTDERVTSELLKDQSTPVSLIAPQPRRELTISFGITNAPSSNGMQDCRTDPETGIELTLDSQPSPIKLDSHEKTTIAVHGALDIRGVITMRANKGCRMQVYVDSAELHN